jgi:tetratricopeptide (TPR) repeat protein
MPVWRTLRMSRMRSASVILILFLILDGALIYNFQKQIEKHAARRAVIQGLAQVPSGEYLKKVSLGHNSLMADLIWLRAIQVMGEKKVPPRQAEWIYHALDAATDLDPKFSYIYEAGGIFLSAVSGNYDLSVKLLKKGFDNNPSYWRLPFYLSANYFLYLQNYKLAAYYMGRAAELPGRPALVPLLAARLYAQSGDPRFGLELTETIYKNTTDEKVREALRQRMEELRVEINLDVLENASNDFKDKYGRYPASVDELKAAGLIRGEPEDELGGRYIINPETGEASNTKMPRRLRIYVKRKKR